MTAWSCTGRIPCGAQSHVLTFAWALCEFYYYNLCRLGFVELGFFADQVLSEANHAGPVRELLVGCCDRSDFRSSSQSA